VCAAQFTVRRRFTAAAYDRFKAVDLLVENAGISSQWLSLSAEGVESQLATNHPGYRSRV
jgi:NAD(P)-dependent dehydrogenase (short-subunit alcohol dehydrogenase family)